MRARQQPRHVRDMTCETHDLAQPQICDALLEDRPQRPLTGTDHRELRYGEPYARHRLEKLDMSVACEERSERDQQRLRFRCARRKRARSTPGCTTDTFAARTPSRRTQRSRSSRDEHITASAAWSTAFPPS